MDNNIQKHRMIVEGMSCGHCKNAVEKAVQSLPGVLSAEVDLITKILSVEVNSSDDILARIKDVVDEQGFTVV